MARARGEVGLHSISKRDGWQAQRAWRAALSVCLFLSVASRGAGTRDEDSDERLAGRAPWVRLDLAMDPEVSFLERQESEKKPQEGGQRRQETRLRATAKRARPRTPSRHASHHPARRRQAPWRAWPSFLQTYLSPSRGVSQKVASGFTDVTGLKSNDSATVYAKCGVSEFAPETTCPDECPYFAESETDFCHFLCVKKEQCGNKGTVREATIADDQRFECRRCDIAGCAECSESTEEEDVDVCSRCMMGYWLESDGEQCASIAKYLFPALFAILGLGVAYLIIWYVDLRMKPNLNQDGLIEGLSHRSRTKLRREGVVGRPLWPLDTNLAKWDVGGVGTICFFRYSLAVVCWAFAGLIIFVLFGLLVNDKLFVLGIMPDETPRALCAAIRTGRQLQMKLVWTKVLWLVLMYGGSVYGAFWYAVRTRALFTHMDSDHMTHADYVAKIKGIPRIKGDERVEELLTAAIEDAIEDKLVGVSLTWKVDEEEWDSLYETCEALVDDADQRYNKKALQRSTSMIAEEGAEEGRGAGEGEEGKAEEQPVSADDAWQRDGLGEKLDKTTEWMLHTVWGVSVSMDEEEDLDKRLRESKELLEGLYTGHVGFAIFPTESTRDAALLKLKDKGFEFGGETVHLELELSEPQAVLWHHGHITDEEIHANSLKAYVEMFVGVSCWSLFMYMPYAQYMRSFSYVHGDEPGELGDYFLTIIVVVTQLGLFFMADARASKIGFLYEDHKQACYIVLYMGALVMNFVLDMWLLCALSYNQMKGAGIRTADGRLLTELTTYQEIFESYPMQKCLGEQVYLYAWPATFFIPYVAEPIIMIWLPTHISKQLTRKHPKLTGRKAEKLMQLPEMEQGRYADINFHLVLAAFIPFFAPAWMLLTFQVLVFSNSYLYCFDHLRILRTVRTFHFSSNVCNHVGQKMFSLPIGILAAALVFKWNQWMSDPTKLASGPLKEGQLWSCMAGAMLGHICLHQFMLEYVVPRFDPPPPEVEHQPYEVCAQKLPATWFSLNPAWCLRSKLIYEHQPPQTFHSAGKEHLAEENPKIGAHFKAEPSILDIDDGAYLNFDLAGSNSI